MSSPILTAQMRRSVPLVCAILILGSVSLGAFEPTASFSTTSLQPCADYDDRFAKLIKLLNYGDIVGLKKPSKLDAVSALGALGDERAVPALIEHLQNEENQNVRYQIVKALGWIGSPQAVPALEQALKDPYPLLRKHAAYVLFTLTGREYDYDKTGLPQFMQAIESQRGVTPR